MSRNSKRRSADEGAFEEHVGNEKETNVMVHKEWNAEKISQNSMSMTDSIYT
jgi:hypothetical protein